MKRPLSKRPGTPADSVRDALTRSQLTEVGAVVIAWNHLEFNIDNIIEYGLSLPEFIADDVIGRIHGMDGKIAIIRLMATDVCLVFSASMRKRIDSTMSAVGECKNARDAVAHARAMSHGAPHITQTSGGRGKMCSSYFLRLTP